MKAPLTKPATRNCCTVAGVRKDFPIFSDPSLVYLDSAASAQKPWTVIEALKDFYSAGYANIHRGVYPLSVNATNLYEACREEIASFLNARSPERIVFTRGATESINLVAQSWGRKNLKAGDEVLITILEHHSNFVPWQLVAAETGAKLKVAGLTSEGLLDLDDFKAKLSARTKIAAITQLANGIGVAPPVKELTRMAHEAGAVVLIDGAQAVPHFSVDVRDLDADFYVFSGHKIYGPTGIGALYGRKRLLAAMDPFLSGGDMIRSVSVKETLFNDVPFKFEAGTPNIAGAVGLLAALRYVRSVGIERIRAHEEHLLALMEEKLASIPHVTLLGPNGNRHGLICFVVDGIHPHDLAQFLADRWNIAVRAGHHCAQPLLEHLCVPATTRASLGMYNNVEDIEALAEGVAEAVAFFV